MSLATYFLSVCKVFAEIQFIQITEKNIHKCILLHCQVAVEVKLTAHFLDEGMALEMRHLMRQGRCHAFWLAVLITPCINLVTFDHGLRTDKQSRSATSGVPKPCLMRSKWSHEASSKTGPSAGHLCHRNKWSMQ